MTWHRRVPIAALIAVALGMASVVLLSSFTLWRDVVAAPRPVGVDYLALYTGGRLFRAAPERLYDLDAQRRVQADLVHPDSVAEGLLPFPYPPYVAAVLAPLDGRGFSASYAIVSTANLALLLAALTVIVRRAPLSRPGAAWLAVATAAALPVWFGIVQGQVAVLALLLTALHVFDMRDGRALRGGVWLGLLVFKPQLAILPVLLAARRRQWSSLAMAWAVAAACWLVVLPRVGWTAVRGYVSVLNVLGAARDTLGVHPERMLNVRSLALAILPGPWVQAAWIGVAFAIALLLVWPPPDGRPGPRGGRWHWAALVVGMTIVPPHVNLHDLSLLVLAAGLTLSAFDRHVPPAAAAGAIALVALPGVVVVAGSTVSVPIAIVPGALLLAFAWLLARNARVPRAYRSS